MPSQTVNIAITGHKDLRHEDLPEIEKRVKNRLLQLAEGKSMNQFKLLCGMAEGADQLVAKVATEIGMPVEAIYAHAEEKTDIECVKISDFKILNEKKDKNTEGVGYEILGRYLIDNSDYLLALWDGVFNGKQGGTSEVVRMAMEGKKPIIIYHLVIPRLENTYPVASLLQQGLSFHRGKFQRIPFTVHYSWVELKVEAKPKALSLWFSKLNWGSEIFRSFILPMILVATTMFLGTTGFLKYEATENFHNALFKSVNLLTFNNSVIEVKTDSIITNNTKVAVQRLLPNELNIARYLGLFTTLITFGIALFFALGEERKRVKLNYWTLFYSSKYTLVLGLGEKSYDLITDLIKKGMKVAVVAPNDDAAYKNEIEKLGAIFIKGSISSSRLLDKMHYDKANAIYIMSDNDVDNVRAAQELDSLTSETLPSQKWYVHIQAVQLRTFLFNNLSDKAQHNVFIFDIYENIARRLQLYYPLDRFHQTPQATEAHVVIFGFGNLGKQMALIALRQGHFEENRRVKISIFCSNAGAEKAKFEQEYPIFKDDNTQSHHLKAIKNNIWQADTLAFYELPVSDAERLSSQSVLFKNIVKKEHTVSLYACFEEGLTSGAFLATLLPKLDFESQKHHCNLQVFCFHNFPDKDEEHTIERNFNKLAPHTPVFCFGNFLDECSVSSINDMALDALPKQIAYWYEQLYGDTKLSVEEAWKKCSEQDKHSNRQAADHLWVKLRTLWQVIDWQFDQNTFEPSVDTPTREKYEAIVSEIEHRRWSADLLLKGFKPLHGEATTASDIEDLKNAWFNTKGIKKSFKDQKLHADLIPFSELRSEEQGKDLSQIQDIPKFLRAIVQT